MQQARYTDWLGFLRNKRKQRGKNGVRRFILKRLALRRIFFLTGKILTALVAGSQYSKFRMCTANWADLLTLVVRLLGT